MSLTAINKIQCDLGISIAEIQGDDYETVGITPKSFKYALVQIARFALDNNFNLSYGGDISYKAPFNFAEILSELVSRQDTVLRWKENKSKKRVANYLAWYLAQRIPNYEKEHYKSSINLIELPAPEKFTKRNLKNEAEHLSRIDKAIALTDMRVRMNKEIDARILMGGKLVDFSGFYPGIMQEGILALEKNKPVYIIGGFGGCANRLTRAIRKVNSPELTIDFQLKENRKFKLLYTEYQNSDASIQQKYPIDYKTCIDEFAGKGIDGLNNGLTKKENLDLFETNNIQEITRLILKGLKATAQEKSN